MCQKCDRPHRRGFLRSLLHQAIAISGVLAGAVAPARAQRKSCRTCQGSGQVLGKCAVCNGAGRFPNGNTCQSCGGSGQRYKFCPACGGSGTLSRFADPSGNDADANEPLAAAELCGLTCIEKDGGSCKRPKHHLGFHHCTQGHRF